MLMRNQKKETCLACCLAENHALQLKASDTFWRVDEAPSCSWAPVSFSSQGLCGVTGGCRWCWQVKEAKFMLNLMFCKYLDTNSFWEYDVHLSPVTGLMGVNIVSILLI